MIETLEFDVIGWEVMQRVVEAAWTGVETGYHSRWTNPSKRIEVTGRKISALRYRALDKWER